MRGGFRYARVSSPRRGIRLRCLFVLQGREEALDYSIVPAVSSTTSARHELLRCNRAPELHTGVLTAAIGVEQHASGAKSTMPGTQERALDKAVQRPTDTQ